MKRKHEAAKSQEGSGKVGEWKRLGGKRPRKEIEHSDGGGETSGGMPESSGELKKDNTKLYRGYMYVPVDEEELDSVQRRFGVQVRDVYQKNIPLISRTFRVKGARKSKTHGHIQYYNVRIPVDKVSAAEIVDHIDQVCEKELKHQSSFQKKNSHIIWVYSERKT